MSKKVKLTASQASMKSRQQRLMNMTAEERAAWNKYQTEKSKESYRKRKIIEQFQEMGVI